MLKKMLVMSGFILLGSLAASAQSMDPFSIGTKPEKPTKETINRDFEIGRGLQRENDRQRREASDPRSGIGIGRESVTRDRNDSDKRKDKKH